MDASWLYSPTISNTSAGTVASAFTSKAAPKNGAASEANQASETAGTSTSGTSTDITANDFLTLLVSELQNQDPTQPTDPNEYITQLAQVNSLEQLVSINQGIGTLDSAVASSS